MKAEDAFALSMKYPKGGTTGQVLTKKSDTNFDVEWKDPEGVAVVLIFQHLKFWLGYTLIKTYIKSLIR